MAIRFGATMLLAALALGSGATLRADGGDWTNRYFGLGWGDGYHAPPRSWLPHHGHGHREGLMPGGYPVRGEYEVASSEMPEWLWDPSDSQTVVVDTNAPPAARPAPAPRPSRSPGDPSLEVTAPNGTPGRTSPEAGRYRPVQARSGGWPR